MSEKLAVLFPGVGYQIDRPLLYHSAKLARERGYARSAQSAIRRCRPVCAVSRRGSNRRLSFAARAREQLSGIVPDQHKQLLVYL